MVFPGLPPTTRWRAGCRGGTPSLPKSPSLRYPPGRKSCHDVSEVGESRREGKRVVGCGWSKLEEAWGLVEEGEGVGGGGGGGGSTMGQDFGCILGKSITQLPSSASPMSLARYCDLPGQHTAGFRGDILVCSPEIWSSPWILTVL